MLGYLVPCSGGKAIALSRTSVYLGRRADTDRTTPLNEQTALCHLRFIDGWWHAEDLTKRGELRINHERCETRRLKRLDELAVGRARFRIDYNSPDTPNNQQTQDADLEQIAASVLGAPKESPLRASLPVPESAKIIVGSERTVASTAPQPTKPMSNETIIAGTIEARTPRTTLGRLIPLGGGPDHRLMKTSVLVGRQPPCDIVLQAATISSRHCALDLIEGYWQVKDLGSRNGIRLDNVRCEEAWVFPDSRLSIADQRFRLDYTPVGEPPVPPPSNQASLMAKAGLMGAKLERVLARQARSDTADEPEKKRWELLDDL